MGEFERSRTFFNKISACAVDKTSVAGVACLVNRQHATIHIDSTTACHTTACDQDFRGARVVWHGLGSEVSRERRPEAVRAVAAERVQREVRSL